MKKICAHPLDFGMDPRTSIKLARRLCFLDLIFGSLPGVDITTLELGVDDHTAYMNSRKLVAAPLTTPTTTTKQAGILSLFRLVPDDKWLKAGVMTVQQLEAHRKPEELYLSSGLRVEHLQRDGITLQTFFSHKYTLFDLLMLGASWADLQRPPLQLTAAIWKQYRSQVSLAAIVNHMGVTGEMVLRQVCQGDIFAFISLDFNAQELKMLDVNVILLCRYGLKREMMPFFNLPMREWVQTLKLTTQILASPLLLNVEPHWLFVNRDKDSRILHLAWLEPETHQHAAVAEFKTYFPTYHKYYKHESLEDLLAKYQ